MKVIIAGSRDICSYETVEKAVELSGFKITRVVSGGARGVDTLAMVYAEENKLWCDVFPANWERYGKGAGRVRNKEMAEYADALIAVWDGHSPGTQNMIDIAKRLGLQIFVHFI